MNDEAKRLYRKKYYESNKVGSIKEYLENNKEHTQEVKKIYYEKNKDKLNEKNFCDVCNGRYTTQNKLNHQQTKKHRKVIKEQT